jgi:hypothetical protein
MDQDEQDKRAQILQALARHTDPHTAQALGMSDAEIIGLGLPLPYTGQQLVSAVKALPTTTGRMDAPAQLAAGRVTAQEDIELLWSSDRRKTVRRAMLALNPHVPLELRLAARADGFSEWSDQLDDVTKVTLVLSGEVTGLTRTERYYTDPDAIVTALRAHGVIDDRALTFLSPDTAAQLDGLPVTATIRSLFGLTDFVNRTAPRMLVALVATAYAHQAKYDPKDALERTWGKVGLQMLVDLHDAGTPAVDDELLAALIANRTFGKLRLSGPSMTAIASHAYVSKPSGVSWSLDRDALQALLAWCDDQWSTMPQGELYRHGDLDIDTLHACAFDIPAVLQLHNKLGPTGPVLDAIDGRDADDSAVALRVADGTPALQARVGSVCSLSPTDLTDLGILNTIAARLHGDPHAYPLRDGEANTAAKLLVRHTPNATSDELVEHVRVALDTDGELYPITAHDLIVGLMGQGVTANEIASFVPELIDRGSRAAVTFNAGEDSLFWSLAVTPELALAFGPHIPGYVYMPRMGNDPWLAYIVDRIYATVHDDNGHRSAHDVREHRASALEQAAGLLAAGHPGSLLGVATLAVALSEPAVPAVA